ncbi:MAG: hypothetical protein JSS43_15595 [Proteobacteria bacterium]|nr:hypothetical protein [Pseudomonadota bacterium]
MSFQQVRDVQRQLALRHNKGNMILIDAAHIVAIAEVQHEPLKNLQAQPGADLADLARRQLAAYTVIKTNRIIIGSPPMLLAVGLATSLGLVLHELATNAAK